VRLDLSDRAAIVDSGRQRDGRTRLAEIIRAINLGIRPMEDLVQYGEIFKERLPRIRAMWSSPPEFTR
jgi:hypothetical protein